MLVSETVVLELLICSGNQIAVTADFSSTAFLLWSRHFLHNSQPKMKENL